MHLAEDTATAVATAGAVATVVAAAAAVAGATATLPLSGRDIGELQPNLFRVFFFIFFCRSGISRRAAVQAAFFLVRGQAFVASTCDGCSFLFFFKDFLLQQLSVSPLPFLPNASHAPTHPSAHPTYSSLPSLSRV